MDVLMAVAPGVALFAIIGFFVWRSSRRSKQLAEAIEQRGWRYLPQPRGFDVDGDTWRLEVRSARGSAGTSSSQRTAWEAPAAPVDEVVVIGPKLPATVDLSGGFMQMFLTKLLGPEATDLRDLVPQPAGSPILRERYSVLAPSPEAAAGLVTPELEAALLRVKHRQLVVLRWKNRAQVTLPSAVRRLDDIEELAALGHEVVEALDGQSAG